MNQINTNNIDKANHITFDMIERDLRDPDAKNKKRNLLMIDKIKVFLNLKVFDVIPIELTEENGIYMSWRNHIAQYVPGNQYNNRSALNAIRQTALGFVEVEDRLEKLKLSNVLRAAQKSSDKPVKEFIQDIQNKTGKNITKWLYKSDRGLLPYSARDELKRVFDYLNITFDVNGYVHLNLNNALSQVRKSAPERYGVTSHNLAFPWHSDAIKEKSIL